MNKMRKINEKPRSTIMCFSALESKHHDCLFLFVQNPKKEGCSQDMTEEPIPQRKIY